MVLGYKHDECTRVDMLMSVLWDERKTGPSRSSMKSDWRKNCTCIYKGRDHGLKLFQLRDEMRDVHTQVGWPVIPITSSILHSHAIPSFILHRTSILIIHTSSSYIDHYSCECVYRTTMDFIPSMLLPLQTPSFVLKKQVVELCTTSLLKFHQPQALSLSPVLFSLKRCETQTDLHPFPSLVVDSCGRQCEHRSHRTAVRDG